MILSIIAVFSRMKIKVDFFNKNPLKLTIIVKKYLLTCFKSDDFNKYRYKIRCHNNESILN